MYLSIVALGETWLKKEIKQSAELSNSQKKHVKKDKRYVITGYSETDGESGDGGHYQVELDHDAGSWFIYAPHWLMPWQSVEHSSQSSPAPSSSIALPEWDQINWRDFKAPVSKYFNVGEVTLGQTQRIPSEERVKQNIVAIARKMDEVREWWGKPLIVTSWYRPWAVNRAIGSRAPNHPNGWAVDFCPQNGDIYELQRRFKAEWYDTGKWQGGFGTGANKGFIHLDLDKRRCWPY